MKNKIVFFITEDWTFVEHRFTLAKNLLKNKWDVAILSRISEFEDLINESGIKILPISISRKNINIISEFRNLYEVFRYLKKEKPAILHAVGIKPNIYGAILARLLKIKFVVLSIPGVGIAFHSSNILRKIAQFIYKFTFRVHNNLRIIVQNDYDRDFLLNNRIVKSHKQITKIAGSGIDPERFKYSEENTNSVPSILFASRLLKNKGLTELVEASNILFSNNIKHNLIIAGRCDSENPNAFNAGEISKFTLKSHIEWLGYRDDLDRLITGSNIIALPTYYPEGLPQIIIESMFVGRAVVATNIPACRQLIEDGQDGFLVAAKDVGALVKSLEKLIQNPQMRIKMGINARKKAMERYSDDKIFAEHLQVYQNSF